MPPPPSISLLSLTTSPPPNLALSLPISHYPSSRYFPRARLGLGLEAAERLAGANHTGVDRPVEMGTPEMLVLVSPRLEVLST